MDVGLLSPVLKRHSLIGERRQVDFTCFTFPRVSISLAVKTSGLPVSLQRLQIRILQASLAAQQKVKMPSTTCGTKFGIPRCTKTAVFEW